MLHSPFVFELYNKCIKTIPQNDKARLIEQVRKYYRTNKDKVNITENGSSKSVITSDFCKNALSLKRNDETLFQLCSWLQPKTILEINTQLGISTAYISHATQANAVIYTIENKKYLFTEAEKVITSIAKKSKVNLISTDNSTAIDQVKNTVEELNAVIINAAKDNHDLLNFFHLVLPKLTNDSFVYVDQIYKNKQVYKGWQEIISKKEVTATIDFYYFGLIFLRKEQAKQNFKLRIF